jgi:hypothetical protein
MSSREIANSNRRGVFDPRDAAAPARGFRPLEGLRDFIHRNWLGGRQTADTPETTAVNREFRTGPIPAL